MSLNDAQFSKLLSDDEDEDLSNLTQDLTLRDGR